MCRFLLVVFVMFVSLKLNRIIILILTLSIFAGSFIATKQTISTQAEIKPIKIAVIMYHGLIKDKSAQNQYMIDPKYFEEDLKYLNENGYHTIFAEQLTDFFEKGKELPKNPVILTFDDGYYNNYFYAYPILKKYNCKAIISPIGITADDAQKEKNKSPYYSQCGWKELREMSDSGLVEIQNHTYNLHKLNGDRQGASIKSGESEKEYKEMLSNDLIKFSEKMYANLGKKPCVFVYPFGSKNNIALNVVKELGYKAVMDCEEKLNYIESSEDLYNIHRFLRPNNMSSKTFFENKVDIGSTKI